MDRGMVGEDNLEFLRERSASYIVGTPEAQLKKFEQQLTQAEEVFRISKSDLHLRPDYSD